MDASTHAERRRRFLEAMGKDAVAVIPSTPVAFRNSDIEHEYRQDSDFYYLTGLDEPTSVLVLSSAHPKHRCVLFVRPRNPEREVWDGPRTGVEGATERFGADHALEVEQLQKELPDYLQDTERLFYRVGRDREMDERVFSALEVTRRRHRFKHGYPSTIVEPSVLLHEHRLVKDTAEIAVMRRGAAVTAEAHAAAMNAAEPGAYEFEVEAEIHRVFRKAGCERPAYESIVGSGPNATILHYRRNDRRMNEGDLLLVDAGCEIEYYSSDVTRTFPVSGKFSEAQRTIYDLVLGTQRACIDAVEPGSTLERVHELALERISAGLIELGLIEGPLEKAIEETLYKPYYMHRTSHWLGMDVHDVGLYFIGGDARPLEPGFVLTVEPGLYIGVNAEVDERWRGIGVRIEDDILVTEEGHENLTAAIPKDPGELERILSER